MAKNLTAKQDLFCREYIVDLNATQAAIRAGYSEKTAQAIGAENLTKPLIAARLAELHEERNKRVEIDADYVLTSLKSIADRCMQSEQVVSKDGEASGEYRFEHSGANKALELLGKHLKLFTDKQETELSGALHLTHDQWIESLS
jgi:phage terminase small subunit